MTNNPEEKLNTSLEFRGMIRLKIYSEELSARRGIENWLKIDFT
jgi:hypothetical protein